jgi:hypothetical protein
MTSRVDVLQLICWHCGAEFDYTPSPMLAERNHPAEFYQGSTICNDCVPYFEGGDKYPEDSPGKCSCKRGKIFTREDHT